MTATITSQTSGKTYALTIDEQSGRATSCSCPNYYYRQARIGGTCKHMQKAQTFQALRQHYDVRSQAQRTIRRTAYAYYEMGLGII